jgi:hypothetical protein
VDVSDVADIGVLDTPIDSEQPPDPTSEAGKMHLPVDQEVVWDSE